MTIIRTVYCFIFFLFITNSGLLAQNNLSDKAVKDVHYLSYDTNLTARIYLSEKYLNTVISNGDLPKLRYRPNSNLSLGVGASYGWFTLNLSAGLSFLKPKDDSRGKTKAYDLQGHFYTPKVVIDLFLGYYDGYYLAPKGRGSNNGKFYSRPDISSWQMGFAGYYAFNWRKFSYRAAFLQTAWQQKSAGSILLGMELHNAQIKGDSALVPAIYAFNDASRQVNQIWNINLGPGAGYAYTLVIARHWYATGAATGSLAANWVRESSMTDPTRRVFYIRPNTSLKAALGYNSSRFSISATWTHNTIYTQGALGKYAISAGNARLQFAYRFTAGKKFKEYWDFMQKPLL